MNRIYIGIGILLALLVLCCIFSFWIPKIHLEISGQLEQAALYARQENWPQASALANQARLDWKRAYTLITMVTDQGSLDQIDGLFAELELYAARQEMPDFAAAALQLSNLTAAIGQSHSFHLWNLL